MQSRPWADASPAPFRLAKSHPDPEFGLSGQTAKPKVVGLDLKTELIDCAREIASYRKTQSASLELNYFLEISGPERIVSPIEGRHSGGKVPLQKRPGSVGTRFSNREGPPTRLAPQ